jgi:uncharacterized protein with HEPN domain
MISKKSFQILTGIEDVLENRIVHDYFGIDYSVVWQIKEAFLIEIIQQFITINSV